MTKLGRLTETMKTAAKALKSLKMMKVTMMAKGRTSMRATCTGNEAMMVQVGAGRMILEPGL